MIEGLRQYSQLHKQTIWALGLLCFVLCNIFCHLPSVLLTAQTAPAFSTEHTCHSSVDQGVQLKDSSYSQSSCVSKSHLAFEQLQLLGLMVLAAFVLLFVLPILLFQCILRVGYIYLSRPPDQTAIPLRHQFCVYLH